MLQNEGIRQVFTGKPSRIGRLLWCVQGEQDYFLTSTVRGREREPGSGGARKCARAASYVHDKPVHTVRGSAAGPTKCNHSTIQEISDQRERSPAVRPARRVHGGRGFTGVRLFSSGGSMNASSTERSQELAAHHDRWTVDGRTSLGRDRPIAREPREPHRQAARGSRGSILGLAVPFAHETRCVR
jgi:hypothetical protein